MKEGYSGEDLGRFGTVLAEDGLSRRDFLRVGGAGLLGLTLLGSAACGGGSGGKALKYWASNQAPTLQGDRRILGKTIKSFEKQGGVPVHLEVIGWTDLFNRITTAISSGQNPDVLNIGNTWSATFQTTGAFLKFDQSNLKAIGGKDKFIQTAYATSGMPGKTFTSVPLYGLAYGLFYNKAMFEKAGIKKPPETWEDFVSIGKELTKPPKQWGFAVEGASITENSHWAFILGRQQGGSLFDKHENPTFDSPEMVAAVKQYIDFMTQDKIVDTSNAQYSTGTQSPTDFANGKAAMVIGQNNYMSILQDAGMSDSDYEVAYMPIPAQLPPGGEPIRSHTAGINISVFGNSPNTDGALKFVKYLTSTEQQTKLNEAFGALPVTKEAAKNKAFQTKKLKVFQDVYAKYSAPMPLIPNEGQMETLVGGAVKNLFAKAASSGSVTAGNVKSELAKANQQMKASGVSGS